jgi:hypothetical protein
MAITRLNNNSITSVTALPSGVGGKVLQVKSAYITTGVTGNHTTFQATGLSVSITPSSTSSKIFATVQGGAFYNTTIAGVTMRCTIYRDSTNLGDSDYGLARYSSLGGSWTITPHSFSVLDSPSSTSSLTYEVYYKNADASATIQFNSSDRGRPTLTLFEIGA